MRRFFGRIPRTVKPISHTILKSSNRRKHSGKSHELRKMIEDGNRSPPVCFLISFERHSCAQRDSRVRSKRTSFKCIHDIHD